MDNSDVLILREVEATFVRNYVDTSRISVDVINRSVYIDGFFHVFDYQHRHTTTKEGEEVQDSGTAQGNAKRLLLLIEQQIRGIREVGSIQFKFTNWKRTGSGWTEIQQTE
ncbi:MAG: hypothetical protein SGI71_10305 [Verrucomicrobiota bacterium]|nr:hypothetical protein [Verrucomicrobiota bacterium]